MPLFLFKRWLPLYSSQMGKAVMPTPRYNDAVYA